MIAAGRAAARGLRVLLLEKNARLGEKLRISGGGRCNITNAEPDVRTLLGAYGTSADFLYSAFSQFGVSDTFAFFESRGLPLKVEARNRAFPKSEKAGDVVNVLSTYLKKGGVTVRTRAPVTSVRVADGQIDALVVGKERIAAKQYVFATGGVSHPETGSTGDGFAWLKTLGHTVHPPTPTIVPLATHERWSKDIAGITLPGAKLTVYCGGAKRFSVTGSVLCTHFGISGPTVLNVAHKVADLLYAGEVRILIDLFPRLDLGALDRRVVAVFETNKNKAFKNVLKEFVPPGASRGILRVLQEVIDGEKKVHSVSKDERKALVRTLKTLPLTVTGLMGFDRAVVADGGVPLAEVDMRTMRSKKVSNLLVTGDLLHITRPSGGYSLQLCWTTGYVAGSSVER